MSRVPSVKVVVKSPLLHQACHCYLNIKVTCHLVDECTKILFNFQASNDEETAVDVSGSYMATSTRPAASFVLISRNILQWRDNGQKLQGEKSL
jgi:hypothetical protein